MTPRRATVLLRLLPLAFAALLSVASPVTYALGVCADGASDPGGIGGTGVSADGGTGGTGAQAQSGGIGGTGAQAQSGGIGGTGIDNGEGGIGGTGIYGTISGFASICVNGVEVHYDDATPVSVNGVRADQSALKVGQLVAVQAKAENGRLQARSVAVLHAVVGPVAASDGTRRLEVLGQKVRITAATRFGTGLDATALPKLARSEMVQVSGQRLASGEVIATRIDRAPADAAPTVVGSVRALGPDGFRVQGLSVVARGAGLPAQLVAGREALVSGRLSGNRLIAERVEVEPGLRPGSGERFSVEGYVHESGRGNRIRVDRFGIALDPGAGIAREALRADRRVRIEGHVRGGELVADRVFLREDVRVERERDARGHRAGDDDRGRRGRDDDRSDDAREDRSGPGGGDRRESGSEIRDDRPGRNRSGSGRDSVERPERIERIDRDERPERIERPEDHSGPH